MLTDLRTALRQLRRAPGFTLVVALVLAFGIGVNTAIFSAVDVALLRPLPFRDAEQLALLEGMGGLNDRSSRTVTFGTNHFSGYAIAY